MNAIVNFAFDEHLVRAVEKDGEPWFVGKDICAALAIRDYHQALETIDDDERGGCSVPTPSGDQTMIVVSEPGVYRLVFRSRKPEAERFKRWLAHEVLPALRRTGHYGQGFAEPPLPDTALAAEPLGAKVDFLRWVQKGRGFEAAAAYLPALGLPPLPALTLAASGTDGAAALAMLNDALEPELTLAREGDPAALAALEAKGAKPGEGGVFVANPAAARIFAGTRLAASWANALRLVPGVASGGRMSLGGRQMRMTFIADGALAPGG